MKSFKEFYTEAKKMKGPDPCWKGYQMIGKKVKGGKEVPNCVPVKEADEPNAERISKDKNKSSSRFWGTKSLAKIYKKDTPGQDVKEETLQERGEDSRGYYRATEKGAGLTKKGAKHFGIKTAVTTPPSKLKKGGTAWKRRKSFCARMSGMKGPMKDEKGRPTRKAMSLRRWNC